MPHLSTPLAVFLGILILTALLALKTVFGRLHALAATKMGRSPFEPRPVMNKGELAMYRRLLQAAPPGTLILPQVQMSGFLAVRGLDNKQERWKYLNRIIRLSLDFLVVDASNAAPLAGVEVDGPSHRGGKSLVSGQQDADARKSQAMKAAGLPLLRISTATRMTEVELRGWLMQNLPQR